MADDRQGPAQVPDGKAFNWFATFGRDGVRTRYRPRTRVHASFFVFVPWLDLIVLVAAFILFSRAMTVVPGMSVDLPGRSTGEGLRSTCSIVARALDRPSAAPKTRVRVDDGATVEPIAMVVFFDDERFDLSQPHHIASFRNALRDWLARSGETAAQLYLDAAITHDNSMRLALLLREVGIERVNYVVQEP